MHFSFIEEIKKYPFVRLLLPFIAGIIISLHLSINLYIIYGILSVSLVFFFILLRNKSFSTDIYKGLTVNLILLLIGIILCSAKLENSKNESLQNYEGHIIGSVINDPVLSERSVRLNVEIEAIKHDDSWYNTSGRTMLYLTPDEKSRQLKSGSKIIFSPQLSEIRNSGNPHEFDYRRYLSYNLIHTSDFLNTDEWDFFADGENHNIRTNFLNFRQNLIQKLENSGLTDDELGVIAALALGYRNRLSDEVRHNYASSGAMHILAVSGLHVGIVYMIIIFALSFIKNKKLIWFKVLLTVLLIWFYAFLTGLSPSVSRAATMFSFIALSQVFKRSPGIFNSIAASAFLLLIINPLMITQIGFQLSYIAVTGIVLIFPHIYPLLSFKNYFLDKIWSLTVVSIAAQIATAPIAIFYFNQFSNYFLLTNYLLIPMASIAIYLTLSVFIFLPIAIISDFFAFVLSIVLKFMNFSTSMIESLPGSVSSNIYLNLPQVIVFYLIIIFAGVFFFGSKHYKHLTATISLIIVFVGLSLYKNFTSIDQQYIIVYNVNRASVINLIDGRDNILFADFEKANRRQLDFSAKNNWLKLGLQNEKFIDIDDMTGDRILSNLAVIDNEKVFQKRNFISFDDKRILLINRNFNHNQYSVDNGKMNIDYIIIADNTNITANRLTELFDFNKLIFDSSNTDWFINRWIENNLDFNLPIHNVRTQGAFVAKLN